MLPDKLCLPNYDVKILYLDNACDSFYTIDFGEKIIIKSSVNETRQAHSLFCAVFKTLLKNEYGLIEDSDSSWFFANELFAIIRDNPFFLSNGEIRDYFHYGGIDYSIIQIDEGCFGDFIAEIDYNNFKIKILRGLTEKRKLFAIWHEIIHAIIYKLNYATKNDEIFCNVVANFIIFLTKNNNLAWLLT